MYDVLREIHILVKSIPFTSMSHLEEWSNTYTVFVVPHPKHTPSSRVHLNGYPISMKNKVSRYCIRRRWRIRNSVRVQAFDRV